MTLIVTMSVILIVTIIAIITVAVVSAIHANIVYFAEPPNPDSQMSCCRAQRTPESSDQKGALTVDYKHFWGGVNDQGHSFRDLLSPVQV